MTADDFPRNGQGAPAPDEMTEDEGSSRRRRLGLLVWLAIAVLSGCLLFTCAQVAGLQLGTDTEAVSMDSMLEADYGRWNYTSFAPISPEILIDIIQDLKLTGAFGPAVVGDCLIPGTCGSDEGQQPTATASLSATPSQSPTVTGTATMTPTVSLTPTASASATVTKTPTNTPTPTPLVYPVKLADPSKLDPTLSQTVQFTIYVINYGSEPPAELETVCDFLPDGFFFDSADRGGFAGTCPDGTDNAIVWNPNVLIPQGSFEKFTFKATTNFPEAGKIYTNTVRTLGGNFETATNWTRMQAYTPTPAATAENDSYSTDEDINLDVLARGVLDNDENGDSAGVIATPEFGLLNLSSDGGFSYQPTPDWNGSDSFIYEACATGGTCDNASVSIAVTPVPDAPRASDDSYSVDEDGFLSISAPGVAGNDVEPDGELLAVDETPISPVSNGTLALFGDGSFNYQPNVDYHGSDDFVYEVCDPTNRCDQATVHLTINPVNDEPVAEDDPDNETPEDTAIKIDVLANDSDIDGDTLNVSEVTQPSNGSVSITDSGTTVTYAPDSNWYGDDSFTYTVSDGNGGEDTATVNVTVYPVNDAPVATDDSASTGQGDPVTIDVLANDTDVESDTLTITEIDSAPANGTAEIITQGTADPSDDEIRYEPDPAFSHPTDPDTFTYRICDDGTTNGSPDSKCDTGTVSVIVNDAPSADDDAYSVDEDTLLTVPAPGVLDGDSDPNGDTLTAVLVSGPSNAKSFAFNSDGSFSYQGKQHFNGEDSFTYEATDGGLNSNTATVTITVNPINDAPNAKNDNATTDINVAIDIDVMANDSDVDSGDVLRIQNGAEFPKPSSKGGTVTLDDQGTADPSDDVLNYDPPLDTYTIPGDPDTFDYTICDREDTDPEQLCDTATVSVKINGPPTANDDSYSTDEDVTLNIAAPGLLDNDTDPNEDTLSASLDSYTGSGSVTVNSDGSFSYTPPADFNGSESFTYQACDPRGLCDTATATITVNAVNDPPDAKDDNATTDEDTAVDIDVLANDSDVEGDTLTINQITSTPSNGTAVIDDQGTADPSDDLIRYTPNTDFNGDDSFIYEVVDGNGGSGTATVTVSVNPQPDPPTAVDDSALTGEDEATTIDVLANDFDVDGDTVLLQSVQSPTDLGGTAVINENGTPSDASDDFIDYTPPSGYSDPLDPDTFTYTIGDGTGRTDTATVSVTVNDAPSATDDSYSTDEDITLSVAAPGVLDNDSDPNGDALQARKLTDPTDGTLTFNSDGSFTYDPDANFYGSDTFTYEACDDLTSGLCDSATVTITVNAVNDAPVASADSAITDRNVAIDIDVLANDSDVDGDTLRIDAFDATSVKGGTVTLMDQGTADPSDDVLNYDPPADTYTTPDDPDTFEYTVCDRATGDPDQLCDTATVTVTVNGPPTANDDSYSTDEDVTLNVAARGVLDNDSDPNGDSLTVSQITNDVDNGALSWSSDGSFNYTPDPDFYGSDGFTYEVCDQRGLCDTATASIQVNAVEDAPIASNDSYSTNEDETLSVAAPGVLSNDEDPDNLSGDPWAGLTVSLVSGSGPSDGALALSSDGSFEYDPNLNFNGTDQFQYEACDGTSRCDTATVTITVESVNDPPQASDDSASTDEDVAVTIDVLANDSDPEGDTLTVSDVTQPTNGSASITDSGTTVTYTPDANWYGDDSFTYTVSDGNGGEDTATVSVTVDPVNNAPVASDDSETTGEDDPVTINVLANDSDVEGDTLSVASVTDPANGSATINPDDTITYQPDPGFSHPTDPDTFTYQVCDDGISGDPPVADSKCDSATGSVIVNDAPAAVDDAYSVDEDTLLSVPARGVLDNDSDPNEDSLSAVLMSGPSNAKSFTLNSDGSFSYQGKQNFNGEDSFTYKATDGSLESGTATVTITVNSVNDLPEAKDDKVDDPIDQGGSVTVTVLANDSDVDGDLEPSTVQVVSGPSAGTTSVDPDDGSITYTHDGGPATSDSFTYNVQDNEGAVSNEATVMVAIRRPDLFADLSPSDASASPGETISFTAAFGNNGPGTAYDVEVTASAGSGCTLLTSNPIFSGVLAEGGGGFETVNVQAPSSSGASCDVSLLVSSSNGIGDGDSSTITVGSGSGSSLSSSDADPSNTPTNTPESDPTDAPAATNTPGSEPTNTATPTQKATATATSTPEATATATPDSLSHRAEWLMAARLQTVQERSTGPWDLAAWLDWLLQRTR